MKTRIFFILLLLIVAFSRLNAQNEYFQKINGEINHIKIRNTSCKCNISIDNGQEDNGVCVLTANESNNMAALQGLFTVSGDSLIVEDNDLSALCKKTKDETDYCIYIRLNRPLQGRIYMGKNTKGQLQINFPVPALNVYCEQNAVFELKIHNLNEFESLNVRLDSGSVFTTQDYLKVRQHSSIVVQPSALFKCEKFALSKLYCKIDAPSDGVILDNKSWKEYKHLQRNENNLPVGLDSWQFYWKPSLDLGLVTPKRDFWGQGTTINGNFDFLLQYNFGYQSSLIFGWGFGIKYSAFKADGYTDNLNITDRENQTLSYTCNTIRLPIIYRRYLDDNIKAPSVDFGLIPYWIKNGKWYSTYMRSTDNETLYKSAVTFSDLANRFQLDAYIGLNLGRKFSVYTQINLLPMFKKNQTDEMRSINIGISYKIDFTSWNFQ